MAKLSITAAVTGSYRRGGLDLSGGKTVEIDNKDITEAQLKSLKSDARVTISEDKAAAKPKPSEPKAAKLEADEKQVAKRLKDAKAKAAQDLKPFKAALTAATKAGGKNKTPEQIAAIKAAQAELETAQDIHDDFVSRAEASAELDLKLIKDALAQIENPAP